MTCYESFPNTYWTTVYASGGGKSHQLTLYLAAGQSGPQQYFLTTAVSPAGAGTISPPSGWYNAGTQVTVTAAANPGYQFTGFSGALSGGSPGYVTMNTNKSVTANFALVQQYSLTTAVNPPGAGAISPASGSYASGTHVQITAAPAAGYTFAGFAGNLTGTALPQNLVMNGNKSVTANFTATPPGQYSLTTGVNTAGGGTIVPGAGSYSSGSQVQVTAAAAPGYTFTGFTGDLTGMVNPQILMINGNKSVTAIFQAVSEPDFTLDLPASVEVEAGFQNSFRLRITPQGGFTAQVSWTLTPNGPGVSAAWAANSQLPLTTATGTLYVLPSVPPGAYSLTVQADGGGKSHSANISVQVTRPFRAQSETNIGYIDFGAYGDSHLVNAGVPLLQSICGNGTGMRRCYQDYVLNSYRAQQISGVRFMFSLADAIVHSTGSIDQTWLTGLRAFFEDLYSRGIYRITPTPSWDQLRWGNSYIYSAPAPLPGCTDPSFYSDIQPPSYERTVSLVRFNRTAPFGEAYVRTCHDGNCSEEWQARRPRQDRGVQLRHGQPEFRRLGKDLRCD
jgi:hypothetical protein